MTRVKRFFISALIGGITVLLPIGILIFIFKFIFDFVTNFLSPISHALQLNLDLGNTISNLLAFSLILGICFVTGFFVTTRLGGFLHTYIEKNILKKIPGYSIVKDTVSQFSENNMKDSFSKVALAEVYAAESLSTVFVIEKTDKFYTLFVPTGPNPTSGNIFHVLEDKVFILDVKIDVAMKSILSAGLGSNILIKNYEEKYVLPKK